MLQVATDLSRTPTAMIFSLVGQNMMQIANSPTNATGTFTINCEHSCGVMNAVLVPMTVAIAKSGDVLLRLYSSCQTCLHIVVIVVGYSCSYEVS